jgi:hypothetical protein
MTWFKYGGLVCSVVVAAASAASQTRQPGAQDNPRPQSGVQFTGERPDAAPTFHSAAAQALGATLHVPADYPTIQAALDAAADGDLILVANGRYRGDGNRNLDFLGKAVTLRSVSGHPAECTIDCSYAGRGFWFHSGETAAATVDGFTIDVGSSPDPVDVRGGGILCTNGSSPTISNCIIQFCQSGTYSVSGGGGGLACVDRSHPTVINCIIEQCSVNPADGAGVLCDGGSNPALTGCIIRQCVADSGAADHVAGGALVCLSGSNAVLTDCLIEQNSASRGVGGVVCCSADPILRRCTITGNEGYFAGGMYCEHSSPTVRDSTFAENAGWCASSIFCEWYSYPEITACRLAAGMPAEGAPVTLPPAILCRAASSVTLASCLINDAAALWAQSYGQPVARNCTFTGTVVSSYSSDTLLQSSIIWPAEMRAYTLADFPAQLSVSYCDVLGGEAAVQVDPGCSLLWGAGNIDTDPGYVSPDGPDGDPDTWQDNDYHLAGDSVCIDAGVPGFAPLPGETDIDDQYRVWQAEIGAGGRVDMGADEFGAPEFGDLNCDGAVNAFDIDAFVLALTDAAGYTEQYPACARALADLNADGAVNAFDIDPFVSRLTGGQAERGSD